MHFHAQLEPETSTSPCFTWKDRRPSSRKGALRYDLQEDGEGVVRPEEDDGKRNRGDDFEKSIVMHVLVRMCLTLHVNSSLVYQKRALCGRACHHFAEYFSG